MKFSLYDYFYADGNKEYFLDCNFHFGQCISLFLAVFKLFFHPNKYYAITKQWIIFKVFKILDLLNYLQYIYNKKTKNQNRDFFS